MLQGFSVRLHARAINVRHLFRVMAMLTARLQRRAPAMHDAVSKQGGLGAGRGGSISIRSMQDMERALLTEGVARAIKNEMRSRWVRVRPPTHAHAGVFPHHNARRARQLAAQMLNHLFVMRGRGLRLLSDDDVFIPTQPPPSESQSSSLGDNAHDTGPFPSPDLLSHPQRPGQRVGGGDTWLDHVCSWLPSRMHSTFGTSWLGRLPLAAHLSRASLHV